MTTYRARYFFDGFELRENVSLTVENGKIQSFGGAADEEFDGLIAPGLVDLQVNGGGGVMLNDGPSPERIATMCAAHAQCGTTTILPTLITAPDELTRAAIGAARAAGSGLHLEGPHLDPRRKGAHRADYIRPMGEGDLEHLIAAAKALPSLLLTVAPESVSIEQATRLRDAGATVFLGHTNCSYEQAMAMPAVGATHLFNAMSPLTHREPGLVGAVFERGDFYAGLIADGVHVAAPVIRAALRAKAGPGRVFLVSDAMATVGSDIRSFLLDGRKILRGEGRLELEDGTLAGADIDLLSCVRFMVRDVGLPLEDALKMATQYPASAIQRDDLGTLRVGGRADMILLKDLETLALDGVWKAGQRIV